MATIPAGQEVLAARGAHTPGWHCWHPTATLGPTLGPAARDFPSPRAAAPTLHPPPRGAHRALTSRKTSQPLIITINMQIGDVSWAGRAVGEPGNVQKEAFALVTFC